jgi:hypothetical protein
MSGAPWLATTPPSCLSATQTKTERTRKDPVNAGDAKMRETVVVPGSGWMPRPPCSRVKCFYLTSPFIELYRTRLNPLSPVEANGTADRQAEQDEVERRVFGEHEFAVVGGCDRRKARAAALAFWCFRAIVWAATIQVRPPKAGVVIGWQHE